MSRSPTRPPAGRGSVSSRGPGRSGDGYSFPGPQRARGEEADCPVGFRLWSILSRPAEGAVEGGDQPVQREGRCLTFRGPQRVRWKVWGRRVRGFCIAQCNVSDGALGGAETGPRDALHLGSASRGSGRWGACLSGFPLARPQLGCDRARGVLVCWLLGVGGGLRPPARPGEWLQLLQRGASFSKGFCLFETWAGVPGF